jgi:hypothetical protein
MDVDPSLEVVGLVGFQISKMAPPLACSNEDLHASVRAFVKDVG